MFFWRPRPAISFFSGKGGVGLLAFGFLFSGAFGAQVSVTAFSAAFGAWGVACLAFLADPHV
jgi:hypothetical protein